MKEKACFFFQVNFEEKFLIGELVFTEKLAKGEAEVRTAEDEDKDVCHDMKNEKEEDSGEQEYVTDIVENMTEKKFKIPSYKYCRQNQIFVGMDYMRLEKLDF